MTKVFTLAPYAYLEMKSRELGLPEAYREDLTVHDRRMCGEMEDGERFAWSVRKCGTHLVRIGHLAPEWARAISRNDSESARFFVYEGDGLREVTPKAWVEWVDVEYRKLPEWRATVERYTGWSRVYEYFTCRAASEDDALEHAKHWNDKTWGGRLIGISQV